MSSKLTVEIEIPHGKFHPCLVYGHGLGGLHVLLRDCSINEVIISNYFDVLEDNHPKKKGKLAGFTLWGARQLLFDQKYKKSSIPLEHLLKRFEQQYQPHAIQKIFGEYKEQIFAIAREQQLVWWVPIGRSVLLNGVLE